MNPRRHTRRRCAGPAEAKTADALRAALEHMAVAPGQSADDWQDVLHRVDALAQATQAHEPSDRPTVQPARPTRPGRARGDRRQAAAATSPRPDVVRAPMYAGDAFGWGTRGL